jgi:hypothetical protein
MLEAVVHHVAPLAKSFEVARQIISRVMVKMRRRQHHFGA